MYYRRQPIISISHIITTIVLIGITGYFLMINGALTIERPYLAEYKQCQSDLSNAKDIKCPEKNCGTIGIIWSICGMIMGIFGYGMFWYSMSRAGKIDKEIDKKREEAKRKNEESNKTEKNPKDKKNIT